MKKKEKNIEPIKDVIAAVVEDREITDELRESYLNYAMSVIVSRALPDVRDGLKPVQRRLLWTMWENGITHQVKHRKSAVAVADTMGRYHPHGDSSIYDTMVRLAQSFSLRYPLVDGQGNFGSIDGDSAAAFRYTEARLSRISNELLGDIEKNTVDWIPNYDGSREEPRVLPAKLPNLLLNGTVGIAVGMATSVPPHHLGEVVDGIAHLADNPDATVKELMKFIPGPDFPTGGVIYDKRAIESAYASGRGPVTMRGLAHIEEKKNGHQIVITEIPYQVNKSTLIMRIAELVTEKKIEGIKDLRDESDREGIRIAIDLKSEVSPQKVLNRLYQYTELQKNFSFNMLALQDGIQPQTLSLKDILVAYLEHRKIIVRKRTEFDLKKAEERAHILEGLVRALHDIDAVISTIKKSKNREEAGINLKKRFKFTDIQSNAILDMRLSALAALERERLEGELKEKRALIKELQLILKSPKKILDIVKTELKDMKAKFSDERRTKIVPGGLTEFREEDLIPNEETIVVLTRDGYVKRMPPSQFRVQKRGGKGLIGLELKDEDAVEKFIAAETHDNILFFAEKGKVFQTKVYEIPVASRTAKGKSIHNYLEIPGTERVVAMVAYSGDEKKKDENKYLVMVTREGIIKKTAVVDFKNVRRNGLVALKLKNGDTLSWVKTSSGIDEFLLSSEGGQAIRFKESQIRPMGRGAAGVRAMRLKKNDLLAGIDIIKKSDAKSRTLLTVTGNGFGKQTPLKEYKTQKRGGGGIKTSKVSEKSGKVIATRIVDETVSEIIAFSKKGQAIRIPLKDIRLASRATQGVRIMNLEKGDELIGIAYF